MRDPDRRLREGEVGDGVCRRCEAACRTIYRYRTVTLEASGVAVAGVLVGVCAACGAIASIPAPSTPALAAARRRAEGR